MASPWRDRLEQGWYRKPDARTLLLAPLGWLFCAVAVLRRFAYQQGFVASAGPFPAPIIVVGNITVGGTGKTPLVIWMADHLRRAGFAPGIVSRGYGGRAARYPLSVGRDSTAEEAGDEAVLLARRTGCPVVVDPDRVAAVRFLLREHPCDVVLSDDGLQHYRMGREIEVAVLDGARRLGNGRCLPAGPLREPASRLARVDLIVCNGAGGRGEFSMVLRGDRACSLDGRSPDRGLESFRGRRVHAVAAIGNPARFFQHLRHYGIRIIPHPFPDHHPFQAGELEFGDELAVLMTEKDAVKYQAFAGPDHWFVPVDTEMGPLFARRLLQLLEPARRAAAGAPRANQQRNTPDG